MSNTEILYKSNRFNNLKEILANSVKLYPNNNAFIVKEKKDNLTSYRNISFTELQNEVNYLGTALLNLGLKNKRIAIIGKNRYEWCSSYLAILNGVGIAVPLDKGLSESEIESLLERSYTDAIFFEEKYLDIVQRIKSKNKNLKFCICMDDIDNTDFLTYKNLLTRGKNLIELGNDEYLRSEIDSEKMSLIIFTSGTTSSSKAVMLSHKNIAENIYGMSCVEKIYSTDISLAFLPFHHTFGSTGFLFFASNGAATAFCDGIKYISKNLQEYKISIFVCVPLLLEKMYKQIQTEIEKQGKSKTIKFALKLSNFLLKFKIDIKRKLFKQIINKLGGNLRFIISGAAAIDPIVAQGFNDFGIHTVQGYGLTETAPVLAAENDKNLRLGSVGLPLPNVEISIENPNEEGIGEIKAKAPNVMLGYYENEDATNEVIKNGWFYTGDLGYIDKDGFLFITGRKKNVVVLKNGKNIYPEELETLINNLAYVSESMVFGYPKDDDLILSVKIVYNTDYIKEKYPNITEESLRNMIWNDIKLLNSEMPIYKHIKKLFITDIPMIKTTTQKVKRFEEIKILLSAVA